MPTYEYACKDCGDHLEVVQKFSDAALTECPSCQGSLRKVFGNVGIVLKGSGFYKTDSRGSSKASSSSTSSSDTASSTSKESSTSSTSDSGGSGGSSSSSAGGSSSAAAAS